MANRNFANSRIYTGHVMPVQIDCQFMVDSTNALGITALKGPYVQNVFMHTATTPGNGNTNPATPGKAVTNPNPAAGTIIVQLQDVFSRLYTTEASCISPLGTPVKIDNSAMTAGVAYVITTLGDASSAKWIAIGVPAGVTPAVGVAFIAASNGGAGNTLTSRVAPTAAAGSAISTIEVVGTPNLLLAPAITAQGFGAEIILQCRASGGTSSTPTLTMNSYTPAGAISRGNIPVATGTAGDAVTNNAGTLNSTGGQDLTVDLQTFTGTPATLTGTISTPTITTASGIVAPADGSIIMLSFLLSNSSVTINGD